MLFLPFSYPSNQFKGRYKNPILYENGSYLPDSLTLGKYSEDMNVQYLSDFIHDNKTSPFFAIYSMPLIQKPWVPTPDDPEYATWDSRFDEENQDIKYFPSMVNYMDKKIGDVLNTISNEGVRRKTLVIFTTDNATNVFIHSMYNGINRKGNKNSTKLWGIRIPLVAMWPAKVLPGQVSNTLIDFTDFLPTLADAAHIQKPTNYGILDGTSFYDNLRMIPGTDRTYSFCHWDNNSTDNRPPLRYVNDTMYKLYETPLYDSFYNVKKDNRELTKLNLNILTPQEIAIRNNFIQVLQAMHN
ncbi:MAG: sulfatase-like hydrolase/transferase [Bacteroidota bacterium]